MSILRQWFLPIIVTAFVSVGPAHALLIDPYFAGHQTLSAATLGDNTVNPVSFGFQFSSPEDVDTTQGFISSNGYVALPGDPHLIGEMYNHPQRESDNALISLSGIDSSSIRYDADPTPGIKMKSLELWAPFWDDFNFTGSTGHVTYGNPDPALDLFVVTWIDAPHFLDPSVTSTFQVAIFGGGGFMLTDQPDVRVNGSNDVVFSYEHLGGLPDGSAEVGMASRNYLATLNSLGIGDATGVITTAVELALLSDPAHDPFGLWPGANWPSPARSFASVPALAHLAPTQQPVPEPSTLFLLGSGLLGLAGVRWRFQRQAP